MQAYIDKKVIIKNAPFVIFFWFTDKLAYSYRVAEENKIMALVKGIAEVFKSPLFSFNPLDMLIGVFGALALKGVVYLKGKNAKKYRQGIEYGSARWGTAEDIKPYIDENFFNNILLTSTERLTMSSRPKNPKYARNKNVLVIGGSGSGKTRFFIKPNIMQGVPPKEQRTDTATQPKAKTKGKKANKEPPKAQPVSYVVTDPNGESVLVY